VKLAILGKSGYGKSTALKGIMAGVTRLLVCDTMREHAAAVEADCGEDAEALRDYLAGSPRQFRAAFSPVTRERFDALCAVVWALGNCAFVVDELSFFTDAGRCPVSLLRLLQQGRHRGIHLVATAQRPARIPRDFTAACDALLAFGITEARDLDYLKSYFGETEQIRALERFEARLYRVESDGIVACRVEKDGTLRRTRNAER